VPYKTIVQQTSLVVLAMFDNLAKLLPNLIPQLVLFLKIK
jgi:hypothetical protein